MRRLLLAALLATCTAAPLAPVGAAPIAMQALTSLTFAFTVGALQVTALNDGVPQRWQDPCAQGAGGDAARRCGPAH